MTLGGAEPEGTLTALFALDELRARHGEEVPEGADPRHAVEPFRAFRAALLQSVAGVVRRPALLSMWWEGSFNGYLLAVALEPGDAADAALFERACEEACPVEALRSSSLRPDRHSLATVSPGTWELARDASGATAEAPFGSPTGHFGAPGVRWVRQRV